MKPFHLALSAVSAAALLSSSGCYSPQPTALYGSSNLPKADWYTLPEGSSQLEAVGPVLRSALAEQRRTVNLEASTTGQISAETRRKIDEMNDTCNTAYIISFDVVASNPTPGLNGYAETWDMRRENDAMIFNQNFRALADEWSRFWLMDMPGGTPYNTLNTTGRL